MAAASEFRTLAEVMGVKDDRLARMAKVAWNLYREHRYRESASVFRGLCVLDPEDIDLYRGLALSASRDNDLLTAIDALEKGERLLNGRRGRESDRGYLLALLSALLYRTGRKAEAVQAAELALELSPPGAAWVEPLKNGTSRAGAVLLRSAKKSVSETASIRRMLRSRLADVGRGQQTLARALGYQDKELVRVFDNGAALLEAGQPRRASRIFEGLVELDGGVPLFHLALGQARELAGHHRAAIAAYDAAVLTARRVQGGGDILADALLRRARHRFKRGKRSTCAEDVTEALSLPASTRDPSLKLRAEKIRRSLAGRTGIKAGDPPSIPRSASPTQVKRAVKSAASGVVRASGAGLPNTGARSPKNPRR